MATWQQTRDSERDAELRAHAWERLARASAAMSRELMAGDRVSKRVLLRHDLALSSLRRLGARTEGL